MHVLAPVLQWWLALTLVGLVGLPFARLLLPTLPDLGIGVARPLGLLLVAFAWWWAVTLGILPNSVVGAWLALLGVGAVGLWLTWREREAALAAWWARRRRFAGLEALFVLALVAWALYRAFYPDVTQAGGEKTMELAFLNGVLASPRFPPNDPWMAGESISYYYFSYVMGALLVRLTGATPTIAFNLLVPGTLAMTLVAAFSLGANLVSLSVGATRRWAIAVGAAAASGLALLGSLQGALEVGYRLGVPGRGFYRWLGIFDMGASQAWQNGAMAESLPGACGKQDAVFNVLARVAASNPGFSVGLLDLMPDRHIWWWRASRVIRDGCTEAIHEFPFFSFMLADAHPHVLSLPFVLLAMSLALALLGGASGRWAATPDGGLRGVAWAVPVIVGGLAFLNTWDLPTYAVLVIVAYGLHLWRSPRPGPWPGAAALAARALVAAAVLLVGWMLAGPLAGLLRNMLTGIETEAPLPITARALLAGAVAVGLWLGAERLREAAGHDLTAARSWALLRFTVWIAIASWLLYVPFHLAFASQASGIAQADFSSRPAQWLVHWGLHYLLVLGATFAAFRVAPATGRLTRAAVVVGAAMVLPSLAWPLDLGPTGTLALAAGAIVLVLVPWPDARGLLAGGLAGVRGSEPELATATLRFMQAAAAVGALAIAAWRLTTPEPLDPDTVLGGALRWTPWTPLLLALPLVTVSAAGLDRWLHAAPRFDESPVDSGETQPSATDAADASANDRPPSAVVGVRRSAMAPVGATFALLCLSLGLLMILGTEFFYVRDIFNSRMNTIFKLFFQGWVLLSVGGAYALFAVRSHLPRPAAATWMVAVALAAGMAALYPLGATWDRTGGFAWPVWRSEGPGAWMDRLSLDGLRYWEQVYPGDLAAVRWLRENAEGTPYILEATGGGYSHTGRIAMATGLPTVLGADGHEQQWRGTREQIDPRKADVEAFYGGRMSEEQMGEMLEAYDVRYVILGDWERNQHGVPAALEARLVRLTTPVFESGGVTVYRR